MPRGWDKKNEAGEARDYHDAVVNERVEASFPVIIVRDQGNVVINQELRSSSIVFSGDSYNAHVNITFEIRQLEKSVAKVVGKIRLDSKAIESIEIKEVEVDLVKNLAGAIQPRGDNKVFKVTLQYDKDKICVQNIMVRDPHPHFQDLKATIAGHQNWFCYVLGSQHVLTKFEEFKNVLKSHAITDPFSRFNHPGSGRFIVQKGMILESQFRPEVKYQPKYSFFNLTEYFIVFTLALTQDEEFSADSRTAYEQSQMTVKALEIPGGADRRYIFFLPLPTEDQVRLTEGDRFKIIFDVKAEDWNTAWNGTVMGPTPGMPYSYVCAFATRPWSKEKSQYAEKTVIKALAWKEFGDRQNLYKKLVEDKGFEAMIQIQASDKPYSHQMNILHVLHDRLRGGEQFMTGADQQLQILMMGSRFDLLAPIDIFASIRDEIPHPETLMVLNDSQKKAVTEFAPNAPCGHLQCHGPPGTGKTYFISQILIAFLTHSKKKKILMMSPNNNGVDALCIAGRSAIIHLESSKVIDPDTRYAGRMHMPETERDIVNQEAKLARPRPDHAAPKPVQDLDGMDAAMFDRLDSAVMVREHHDSAIAQKYDMINDKRVQFLQDAIGYKMLEMGNAIPSGPKPAKEGMFDGWLESYNNYKDGHEFNKEQMQTLKTQTRQLQVHTIHNADILACTPDMAADPAIYSAYNDCDVAVLDEACRVSEAASRVLDAYYPKCKARIYVGDKMQLKVVVPSSSNRGDFQDQLLISEMTRLQSNGFPTVLFDVQYRMVPEIAEIANESVYHGMLKNDHSTFVENRPRAQNLKAYCVKNYQHGHNVIFLDIVNAETKFTATKSRYNDTYVMHGMNEAARLMDEFPEYEIAYLTAYQAQKRNLTFAKEKMVNSNASYDRLVVDTIDSRQGDQWDITIIDLLVIGKSAGFQAILNRLCVYFTRAKNLLVILGTKSQIDMVRDRWLKDFQSGFLKYRVKVEAETVECPYFAPGTVDMASVQEEDDTNQVAASTDAMLGAWGDNDEGATGVNVGGENAGGGWDEGAAAGGGDTNW